MYLSRLLGQEETAVACVRCVVQTVLHLRYFVPDGAKSLLDYNTWLDVDYFLLSRSAVTCGAYTTALLFLELAFEYRSQEQLDEAMTERILSSIYNCIDEPDGFYGIKSKDLSKFLLRRFQHEKQWDKAFQFHGAGYEADGVDSERAEGILESLHSFGFNRLALSTLQSLTSSYSSNMSYTLGWRTDTWDLPEALANDNHEVTMYNALRAVHRERDPASVDSVVCSSLSNELLRLKELGTEDLKGIRLSVRNLMCLAQVRLWRRENVQTRLDSRAIQVDDEVWTDFCRIYPDIE